ncbi:hypothetical protein CSUI_010231 [Cystoisospora suis]|uniref:Uncharacterized protein n=1 Tax=Cystoisospora suis TaxID=483139 RepID=A0A2C6KHT5_9APIC|nr:hypothetical protein CSUI_010231 [Cystoisospora suis]
MNAVVGSRSWVDILNRRIAEYCLQPLRSATERLYRGLPKVKKTKTLLTLRWRSTWEVFSMKGSRRLFFVAGNCYDGVLELPRITLWCPSLRETTSHA